MTTTYKDYVRDVIASGITMLAVHKRMARELVKVLWNENIAVDYVWYMVSSYPVITMRAIVDSDDEMLECVAVWEYDHSRQSDPFAIPWELADVELVDLPSGLV